MRRRAVLFAVILMGSLGLPVGASAAAAPSPFTLTLAPAKLIMPLGQQEAALTVWNGGTLALPLTVVTGDSWLVPDVSAFTLAPGTHRTTTVRLVLPPRHDVGDHNDEIAFTVPAKPGGNVSVSLAVAATVIIETGGRTVHGVRWDQLRVPAFVDSTLAQPVLLSINADNRRSTVHALITDLSGTISGQRVRFEAALLLRGEQRQLRAAWTPPLACWCTVAVRGLEQNVLVLPLRAALAAALSLTGLIVLLRLLRRRRTA